jgi:excisionase family DNA binding protein
MTTPIDWVTPKKIAEDTGISRSYVIKLLETGEIKYSKNGKRRNAGIMVSISSFNKFWERNGEITR